MAISKVYLNSDVQMDVTDTTASQSDVASTKYYYDADGVKKQGSYVVPSAVTQATPTISVNSSTGLITASSTQSAGVVSAGTKSATEQLSTENGKTVAPTTSEQTAVAANKYTLGAIKVAAMPAGSASTPATSITANPSISVSSSGLITATASATKSVTPTVSAGYVSSGTAGTITVSGSNTEQLSTQAAQTLYPSTTDQTISSGKYLTGTQTFKGVLLTNLTAGNIKKDVVVKVGDSADDDRITSVTGTYEGSGGGGIEYETGSVTLVTDATQLTISFSNSHLSRPMAFMLSAPEDTMSINFNTSFIWTLLSYYDAFGLSIGGKYGRMQTIYSNSTGAAQSQGTDLTSINGATASSLAYYCDNNAITPKSGNASRFFRAGITYDWVAVWPPTV